LTVLLAGDDRALRSLLEIVLLRAGYHVIAVSELRQALTLAASPGFRADLILADIDLPGADGGLLATLFCDSFPGVKVLFLTGDSPHVITRRNWPAGSDVLHKPFRPSQLVAHVQRVIGPLAAVATAAL
jgi:DNA-binding response OmpR family regulator